VEFERGLDSIHPERSAIPCRVLGYGEISTVFEIHAAAFDGLAFKRMSIFETPEELREEAASDVAFAHGAENSRKAAIEAGEQNPEILADLEGMADRARKRAAALRQEAERLEQVPEVELPSGSITNPDGTRTEMERLPDGTRRETRLDSQGNVLSTRVVEQLPGDWARSEHTDEG